MKKLLLVTFMAFILFTGCKQDDWVYNSPAIGEIQSSKTICFYGDRISLDVEAETPNNEELQYLWLCSEGKLLSKTGPAVTWEAPELDGDVTIIVIATHQSTGKEIKKSLTMKVSRAPAANTEEGSFSVDPSSGDITIGNPQNPEANIEVLGILFGAARDVDGNALKIVTGETKVGDWKTQGAYGVYVYVDTSAGGFTETPFYFTNLSGNGDHWLAIGATSIYDSSPTGFRVNILYEPRTTNALTLATTHKWTIKWMAVGR